MTSQHARPLVAVAAARQVLAGLDAGHLDPVERTRGAALRHPDDRAAHAAAHLLARWCVAALAGIGTGEVGLVQHCPSCGGRDHGRPSVAGRPDLHVSLAHSRAAVAAAASTAPVGVDVEPPPAPGAVGAAARLALAPAERHRLREAADPGREFVRTWVRKEALVKAGAVDLDGLSAVDLSALPRRTGGDGLASSRYGALHLTDWYDEGLGVAVGVAAAGPAAVLPFR